jgi:hypothetical protein
MKCPSNCRCGKHDQHHRNRAPRNTTFIPGRHAYSSTYGEQQRERMQRATAGRKAAEKRYGPTPSESFDFDAAIMRLRKMLDDTG